MEEAQILKEEGNQLFKVGKYEDALSKYTEALKLNPQGGAETAVYHKNKAACNLKLEKFSEAANDCSKALDLTPHDSKALFRRCQALENLERYEEAYKDAMELVKLDPKNGAVQTVLQRLGPIIQCRINERSTTDSKVTQMFELTFDPTSDPEKRKQAATNLIVLARDDPGAEKIFRNDGIEKLTKLLESEREMELKLTAARVLACLAHDCKLRARAVLRQVTLKRICLYMSSENEELSAAMSHMLQNILKSVTQLERIKKDREKFESARKADVGSKLRPWRTTFDRIDEDGIAYADEIFPALMFMLNQSKVSAYGRDNVMELIIKFVTKTEGVGWTMKFIHAGGVQKLLEIAGTISEHKTIPTTPNSRMHASLTLSKIYDDLMDDKPREVYVNAVNEYFEDMLGDNMLESKLEAVMALAALLQGPIEVGNAILGRQGVLEMILAMADSDNLLHIKYAVEALVQSASKKDKCSGVIKPATPILKKLYQSHNDAIKVRALVGLCKLGSFGGSDTSAKSLADGSTVTLSKACRKFLCNETKDADLRKWAAEGLAYLTLDADVKEDLMNDTEALKSLIDLSKIQDRGVLYPVAQVFVNCTNSYDKPEAEKELVQLAKFAKQHVPEDHPKDQEPFITERRKKLVAVGVVNALVALSKTESDSSRELLARVYLAVCWETEHRGLVVQQGGAKALIPLGIQGTDIGKAIAAQALAKIAITSNPVIAFPGQRACEVVRPLLQLLDVDRAAIQNYEALMALTNLASVSETIRQRIVKEKGVPLIEHYCYEEHEQLRQAAMECMCNLIMSEQVREMFKGKNDRVKLFVLYSGEVEDEDDIPLVRAAAGGLAILSHDKEICHKIIECTEQWFRILQQLAVSELPDLQHRGNYILMNMMMADKDIAERLVDSTMLEVLMAVSRLEEPEKEQARQCAASALEQAVEWGLIKPSGEAVKRKPKKERKSEDRQTEEGQNKVEIEGKKTAEEGKVKKVVQGTEEGKISEVEGETIAKEGTEEGSEVMGKDNTEVGDVKVQEGEGETEVAEAKPEVEETKTKVGETKTEEDMSKSQAEEKKNEAEETKTDLEEEKTEKS